MIARLSETKFTSRRGVLLSCDLIVRMEQSTVACGVCIAHSCFSSATAAMDTLAASSDRRRLNPDRGGDLCRLYRAQVGTYDCPKHESSYAVVFFGTTWRNPRKYLRSFVGVFRLKTDLRDWHLSCAAKYPKEQNI